jgi:hypothetical protein
MAMVLVFTMPLCCCIVKTATGASQSCCVVEKIETTSCCQQQKTCDMVQSSEQEPENTPCDGDCGCTIKGAFFTPQWTPPVDIIGVDSPTPFFVAFDIVAVNQNVAHKIHDPPTYKPYLLGFSGAPPMRGSLILQV